MKNYFGPDDKGDSLDFQIAIASIQTIIIQKLQELSMIQIDFLRKFQSKMHSKQSYPELIFYFRSIIKHFDQIFKDTKTYFQDLQIPFVFDFFRKIQMIMIHGVNMVSQALIINIKQIDHQREIKENMLHIQNLKEKKQQKAFQERLFMKLQNFDKTINFFEQKQSQINEELKLLSNKLLKGKPFIQRLCPSNAVKQLSQIKQISECLLDNTQRIFQDTYTFKALEFKDYLEKLKRSDDISNDFCKNLGSSIKQQFSRGVKKAVNKIIEFKEKQQIQLQVDVFTQTQNEQNEQNGQNLQNFINDKLIYTFPKRSDGKSASRKLQRLKTIVLKKRKLDEKVISDQQKKYIKALKDISLQKDILLLQIQQCKQQLNEKCQNYEMLKIILQQKKQLLAKQHIQYQQLQSSYNIAINNIKNKIKGKCKEQQIQVYLAPFQTFDAQAQTAHFQNQTIAFLKNYINKLKDTIIQYKKTVKELSRQNYKIKRMYQGKQTEAIYEMLAIQRVLEIVVSNENVEKESSSQECIDRQSQQTQQLIDEFQNMNILKVPINPLTIMNKNPKTKIQKLSIFNQSSSKAQKCQLLIQAQDPDVNRILKISTSDKIIQTQNFQQNIKNHYILNKKIIFNQSRQIVDKEQLNSQRNDWQIKKKSSNIGHKNHKTTLNLSKFSKLELQKKIDEQNNNYLYSIVDRQSFDDLYKQNKNKNTFQFLNLPTQFKNTLEKRKQLTKQLIMNVGSIKRKMVAEQFRNSTVCMSFNDDEKIKANYYKKDFQNLSKCEMIKVDKISKKNITKTQKDKKSNKTYLPI